MRRNWQNFNGFVFIPLVMSLVGGVAGAAIGGGAIAGIGFAPMLGLTGTQVGAMLGMMAGSTLGNLLFPTKHETHWPELGNYPVQMSTKGPPLQKVLGTRKVSGNVTWEGDIHPYTVKHSAGGGKGGGGEVDSYETRYRQSFLIDLGEGPASILRIWADNKQIWPNVSGGEEPDITIFEGIDNSGIKDLTGEDYGEWPHNCCMFFDEYDLGNNQMKPNFTFEVSGGMMPFFAAVSDPSGKKILWKIKSDGTVDTSWATNGYWTHNPGWGYIESAYDMYQMPDGRLLVLHDQVKVDDDGGDWYAVCTMLKADGTIDTSWGTNGYYISDKPGQSGFLGDNPTRILRDDDGNFYIFSGATTGVQYNFHKFDKDGNQIFALMYGTNGHLNNIRAAVWSLNKERIILSGGSLNVPGGGQKYNVCAINPSDGSIDTTWEGNLNEPGYARSTTYDGGNSYDIACLSDGGFVVQHSYGSPVDDYTLAKLDKDGKFVTRWGVNGHAKAGWPPSTPCWSIIKGPGDQIWTLACQWEDGELDQTIMWLCHWDSKGNLIDKKEFDAPAGWFFPYHAIGSVGGRFILGTKNITPANYRLEWWTPGLGYIGGVTPSGWSANYVRCIIAITSNRNVFDANFATMCKEVLTDSQWAAGFDSSLLNEASFNAVEDYCGSQGLLGSIVIGQQKSWRDWLDYICSHFGGYYFESGGQICLGVYKDEEPVFNLTLDDFVITEGENPPPPIAVKERDESESYNQIKVAWTDRDNDYDIGGPAVAADETNQRWSGQIREKIYDLKGITNAQLAQRMAYQLLIEAMYRFKIYSFTVTYKNMLLEVGDVGTIDDGDQISAQKVRIIRIDEDKNGRGLAITAVEDITELYPEILFATQENLKAAPEPIDLEDATINFREDTLVNGLYLSITPGSNFANGWYIYRSYDDEHYELIGRCGIDGITGGDANSSGTIQSSLPAHGSMTWAPDESFLVDIGTVTDLRTDITEDEFWNDRNCLIRIGDEILAYRDAEETDTPGIWQVSFLRRGCFGTEAAAHSSGASFCTLDSDFAYKFNESEIGQTLYFKAATFYGDDVQNIASLSGAAVTIQGYYQRPAAASLLRLTSEQSDGPGPRSGDYIQYSGSSFTLYWNLGSRVSGWNWGGWDVSGGGVPWNNYIADAELEAIILKFEQENGTPIGQREIAVGESATITKATDLGGYNPARIKVVPRRVLESRLENRLLVDDGS